MQRVIYSVPPDRRMQSRKWGGRSVLPAPLFLSFPDVQLLDLLETKGIAQQSTALQTQKLGSLDCQL